MREPFINWAVSTGNCDPNEAIDIFQVSVIILYENVISGKIDRLDNLKAYLFRIGKNKLMEHFRRLKKHEHKRIDCDLLLKYSFEEVYKVEEHQIDHIEFMHQSIIKLGDPCKSILQAFYFHKKNMDEIAANLDYKNSNTVKSKKFKCIQRLKKIFNEELNTVMKN